MNDLLKQIAKPPIKYTSEAQIKYPNAYEKCTSCSNIKRKGRGLCRRCRTLLGKPPIIDKILIIENERCRKIPLTQGQYAIVDEIEYDRLMQYSWFAFKRYGQYGAATAAFKKFNGGKMVPMANLIIDLKRRQIGDHKNHNPLDHRRSNLRPATQTQNTRNRRAKRGVISGYKGVQKQPYGYIARIRVNGNLIYLGFFKEPEKAARAYDCAAVRYFGEFACLNFSPKCH